MNFLLVRFAAWALTLVVFPISVTLWPYSFQLEVLGRTTFAAALPPESELQVDLAENVMLYLQKAERKETDPWLRDDIRIAWITTKWSRDGVPGWSWHRDSSPYVAATYQVLRCRPDQVWPRIVALRKLNLGSEYSRWYDDGAAVPSSPKKPCASERRTLKRKAASGENLAA